MTNLTLTSRGRIAILPIRISNTAEAETKPKTRQPCSRSAAEIQHMQKSMLNAMLCCAI